MKRKSIILFVLVAVSCLVLGVNAAIGAAVPTPGPHVTLLNPISKADAKSTLLTLVGSGFQPKTTLNLVMEIPGGSTTDLSWFTQPIDPKGLVSATVTTNEVGAFAAVVDVGTFVSKKMIGSGLYQIDVKDADYNTLATIPFGLYDPAKSDGWPNWVSANVPAPPQPSPSPTAGK